MIMKDCYLKTTQFIEEQFVITLLSYNERIKMNSYQTLINTHLNYPFCPMISFNYKCLVISFSSNLSPIVNNGSYRLITTSIHQNPIVFSLPCPTFTFNIKFLLIFLRREQSPQIYYCLKANLQLVSSKDQQQIVNMIMLLLFQETTKMCSIFLKLTVIMDLYIHMGYSNEEQFSRIHNTNQLQIIIYQKGYDLAFKIIRLYIQKSRQKYSANIMKLCKKRSITGVEKENYFCSELVAACYKNLGIMENDISSCQFWPKDFAGNVKLVNNAELSHEIIIYQ